MRGGTLAKLRFIRSRCVFRINEVTVDLTVGGSVESAVSGDGALLFVTSQFDDALSVWRVNAEAGTLSQTAIYQDSRVGQAGRSYIAEVDGRVDGLRGVRSAVVSGDGALLFVTADFDNALSVWRINALDGTLIQTAIYQDSEVDEMDFGYIGEVDGRVDGLSGAIGAAVSGDLLFVTAQFGDTLSVWRVNTEAGSLSQTALYQDNGATGGRRIAEVDGRVDGLEGAIGAAVSGSLLFVTGFDDGALSVWRIDTEAGELSQIVVYRDRVDGIDGLEGALNAAVSSDGALLFVTANPFFNNSALSVWRVNESSGTLRQTAVYQNDQRDREEGIDGLNGALSIELSGTLLFVTAFNSGALSAWHINDAEVSLKEPTVVRVESDMPVAEEVVVTVTARRAQIQQP